MTYTTTAGQILSERYTVTTNTTSNQWLSHYQYQYVPNPYAVQNPYPYAVPNVWPQAPAVPVSYDFSNYQYQGFPEAFDKQIDDDFEELCRLRRQAHGQPS